MNAIWYYIIGFTIIWIITIAFKDQLEKYGVFTYFPVILWKTKRFKGFIEKIANISPRFWKFYMNIGVVVAFISMIAMFVFMIYSVLQIGEYSSVSLVIPGVEVPGSPIFIPFIYGILALITVLIVHEFSHGILFVVEGIDLKSVGLALFAILPGAFAEPDEEDMEKAKKISRTRTYAAGSVANIVLAIVALLCINCIAGSIIPNTFEESGVRITNVIGGTPSDGILTEGMLIKEVNGTEIKDSKTYLYSISNIKPNSNLSIKTDKGSYVIKTATNPNNKTRGYLGISTQKELLVKYDVSKVYGDDLPFIWIYLRELFNWIFILNLSVGLFNLLPMKPLDGGHMFYELLTVKYSKLKSKNRTVQFFYKLLSPLELSDKNAVLISTFFTWFFALLIIMSLLFGMFRSYIPL